MSTPAGSQHKSPTLRRFCHSQFGDSDLFRISRSGFRLCFPQTVLESDCPHRASSAPPLQPTRNWLSVDSPAGDRSLRAADFSAHAFLHHARVAAESAGPRVLFSATSVSAAIDGSTLWSIGRSATLRSSNDRDCWPGCCSRRSSTVDHDPAGAVTTDPRTDDRPGWI